MSNHPYNVPAGYAYYGHGYGPFDPFEQLRRPARLAGISMIVLGALMLVCGGCLGAFSRISLDKFMAEIPPETIQEFSRLEAMLGITLNTYLLIVGIAGLSIGLVVMLAGIMARSGQMGWLIVALVVMSLLSLVALFGSVTSVVADPRGACVWLPAAGISIAVVVGLIVAMKNNRRIAELTRQMQMQLLMQQQQQQQQQTQAQAATWPYSWTQPPHDPPSNQFDNSAPR